MNDLMFIAELGSNWWGSIDIAKYLIDKAAESGASHIKMQLWKAKELYDESWEWYEHAVLTELSYDDARILKKYTEEKNMQWFASVHTKEDIDFLIDVRAPFIKIKGSQFKDYDLIDYAHNSQDFIEVIASTPDYPFTPQGTFNLYMTSIYPSKFNDINFKAFKDKYIEGFSDHTQGIQASLCAAMYPNIRIFEFHFTSELLKFGVDETKTPDHCVSKYPEEVSKMISRINHIKGT